MMAGMQSRMLPHLRLLVPAMMLSQSFASIHSSSSSFPKVIADASFFGIAGHYRLGGTNDEGWYVGQCRFSKVAPAWGEFYEVDGDLKLESSSDDWVVTRLGTARSGKAFPFIPAGRDLWV
jgi:hypothetical protein